MISLALSLSLSLPCAHSATGCDSAPPSCEVAFLTKSLDVNSSAEEHSVLIPPASVFSIFTSNKVSDKVSNGSSFFPNLSAMGTWTGFYPRLHLSLGIWLMIAAHTLQNTKAEITCASCPSPVQLHADKIRLGIYTPPTDEAVTLKNIRVEFTELTEQNSDHEKSDSAENAHHLPQKDTLDGVSAKETSSWYRKENYNGTDGSEKGEDDALWRGKRTLSESAEFRDNGWTGALDDRDLKNRGDATENNRQDEPKLISSTFALAGDSAHNHAVVYWSGQNSSVSNHEFRLFLCILLHSAFHINSVTLP